MAKSAILTEFSVGDNRTRLLHKVSRVKMNNQVSTRIKFLQSHSVALAPILAGKL